MVEEQSHLLTGDGLKDQENVLLSNEKESVDDIKEVVPSQEMPLKNKADSLAHEDSEAVGQDKKTLDTKGEGQVGNEDNSTVDTKEETTSDIKETMVSNTAEINKDREEIEKTEDDETSTNSKEAPEDTDISQKAQEAEDNTVCKDDETKKEDQLLQAEGEQISDDSTTSKSPSEETTRTYVRADHIGYERIKISMSSSESATKAKIPPPAKAPSKEKEHPERKQDLPRSKTMPKSYGRATRKDIAEKFGGVGTSGVRVQRSTSCGASAVKNMLLDWCRAKTKGYEGVDIQNFSSSWSNGLAFCSLMHAFFPDAFDYDSLDPKKRRENFQLAFDTAENLADCPPLLDVEDMVRMKVPDSKCVYTYVQELYRSLVAKGLVKTKKA